MKQSTACAVIGGVLSVVELQDKELWVEQLNEDVLELWEGGLAQ